MIRSNHIIISLSNTKDCGIRGWQWCAKLLTTKFFIKIHQANSFILLWWKNCVKLVKNVIISDPSVQEPVSEKKTRVFPIGCCC